ncbi:MAG: hypothetical protein IBJ04_01850 [Hydrogenophaga sp.]|uniref:hypothetical protein n=1 Tax=Hydrogenophaga sp. TaxID=1904254 RepID=UPI00257E56F6|nr:hypothetical protein [Hydrogenophaga sp.]MBL0943058.1 hypothetical protein [Hydrogenophaga sp.]
MSREILKFCDLQVCDVVSLLGGDRIVHLSPYSTPDFPMGKDWPDIELANHNVFRMNVKNEVVWQVRRVENETRMPWDRLHERAKEMHAQGNSDGRYTAMGFLDPFTALNLDERSAIVPEPKGVWRPGCEVYLLTRWWSCLLDPETGIAACTGEQLK